VVSTERGVPVAATSSTLRGSRGFDLDGCWDLNPHVSLRQERFGALAYDFGTRRLSFLKTRKLLAVVEALAEAQSCRDACFRAGVTDAELPAYALALERLADSGLIAERAAP